MKDLLSALALASGLLFSTAAAPIGTAPAQPNISPIMPDEVGYGDYACPGNPQARWPDRTLLHHIGRWLKGKAADAKYAGCAIQNSRFTLVNNAELHDRKADLGETTTDIAARPEVVANLRATYDQWWSGVPLLLVNENVSGPSINPVQALYYRQFGGSRTPAAPRRMNPRSSPGGEDAETLRQRKAKVAK